jgi:hypothetical protein
LKLQIWTSLSRRLIASISKDLFFVQHPISKAGFSCHATLRDTDVVSGAMTSVWDMESPVDPDDSVESNHNDLDGEVEDVKAFLGMVPSWVSEWSRDVADACSECRAESE